KFFPRESQQSAFELFTVFKHNVKDSAAPWPQTSMEVPSTSPTARWFSEGELGSKKWPPNVALCE
ncbi:hypothetical protein D6D13_08189, partial [Aureobasidium pullulans]